MTGSSQNQQAWTLYWQSNTLDSCVANAGESDRQEFESVWTEMAKNCDPAMKVLDLATGNGTVAAALLRTNPGLLITGVDMASIDPIAYVMDNEQLQQIEFVGETDIEALPFDDHTFDCVTSQFGIEYATLERAVPEAVRVLVPGGQLCFLVHHIDGEIVKSILPYKTELEVLLADDGLVQAANAFALGKIELAKLESLGQSYLQLSHVKTKRISEQVFAAIERLIQNVENVELNTAAFAKIQIRLEAEYLRLQALVHSAKSQQDINDLEQLLRDSDVTSISIEPFLVGKGSSNPALVAWLVNARKASLPAG